MRRTPPHVQGHRPQRSGSPSWTTTFFVLWVGDRTEASAVSLFPVAHLLHLAYLFRFGRVIQACPVFYPQGGVFGPSVGGGSPGGCHRVCPKNMGWNPATM